MGKRKDLHEGVDPLLLLPYCEKWIHSMRMVSQETQEIRSHYEDQLAVQR